MRSIVYTEYPKFMRDQMYYLELKETINQELSRFFNREEECKCTREIIDLFKEEHKDLINYYKYFGRNIEKENTTHMIFCSQAKNILSTESAELIFNTLENPFLKDNHNYYEDYGGTRDWYEHN